MVNDFVKSLGSCTLPELEQRRLFLQAEVDAVAALEKLVRARGEEEQLQKTSRPEGREEAKAQPAARARRPYRRKQRVQEPRQIELPDNVDDLRKKAVLVLDGQSKRIGAIAAHLDLDNDVTEAVLENHPWFRLTSGWWTATLIGRDEVLGVEANNGELAQAEG